VVGTIASLIALHNLSDARVALADRLDPAAITASDLKAALVDQETGVLGFALTGQESFLAPYDSGGPQAERDLRELDRLGRLPDLAALRPAIQRVGQRAREWQTRYAQPTIAQVRADPQAARSTASIDAGKAAFDAFRTALDGLQAKLAPVRAAARGRLDHNARVVFWWVLGTGIVVLLSVLGAAIVLRRQIVEPLQQLAANVRRVARGVFDDKVAGSGAREVVTLGDDVDQMRSRIVAELDALRVTQEDLKRSNAELVQFAYVASHDLQEPLRKVASFCQLLQQRYGGQLDARADQYIGFAVDGARRMQELINDLLAFSRVGRIEQPHTDVDTNLLVDRVESDLGRAIEESHARIETRDLPTVHGDASLLRLVFQNLIANAIKFRGEDAPVIELSATRDDDFWTFRCADNGIGIDAEYAERIFVIFQRLHPRTTYEGTGIGLAMCRKIVEYHGGRMWLDTSVSSGSTFCFTLPANVEDR
jgi:signal transduction histidine kinase